MRQTTARRPPEKIVVTTSGDPSIGAGDHLDLGMIVSVHCVGGANLTGAAITGGGDAAKLTQCSAGADDAGACFTEH